jgi:hypothetical protein
MIVTSNRRIVVIEWVKGVLLLSGDISACDTCSVSNTRWLIGML